MKTLILIHKWVGLAVGLLLFVLCISGAFIVAGRLLESHAPVFRWMMRLHRSLFLGETGHYIVGVATLLTALELITGYCIWGKIAAKAGVNALKWNFPNLLRGLHNGVGLWAGIPLLIMALTGLTWSFGWYGNLVYGLLNIDFHTIIGLHTGGLISRWLWLAAAILGATLPVTGIIITIKKLRIKR